MMKKKLGICVISIITVFILTGCNNNDDHNYLTYLESGMTYYEKSLYNESIDNFTKALKIKNDNGDIYIRRGVAFQNIGKYNESIADLTNAIEMTHNGNSKAYSSRGISYQSIGKHNEAIADFTKAISINPDDPYISYTYIGRGVSFKSIMENDKAIADFTKAISLDPNNPNPYYHRGLIYSYLGKEIESGKDMTKAIELSNQ